MNIKSALFVFITSIAFVFNCSKSDETYTIETIEGVRHIHNNAPAWGDEPKVKLELVRTYSSPDEQDENLQFYNPRDVGKDSEGNLYVLDAGNYRIQKFDPDGNFIATFGRRGQGPGEFMLPHILEVDAKGNMYIYDRGKLIVLNSAGKQIRTIRPAGIGIDVFSILPSGNIGMSMIETKDMNTPLVGIFDNEFKFLRGIGEKKDFGNDVENKMNNATHVFDKEENTFLAFVCQNRIEKYSPEGNLLWQADRPLNYKLGVIEIMGNPMPVPVSGRINIDHKNRFWVVTFNRSYGKLTEEELMKGEMPSDMLVFHVFDNDGIFLGVVPSDREIAMSRIFSDRVYIIDKIEMSILEYKIVEK